MTDNLLDATPLLPVGIKILIELERAQARAPRGYLHIIRLKDAAFVANRSESQMRRLAQANPYGIVPGGYGYRKGGERGWEIVALPFLYTLPLNMIGRLEATRSWATMDAITEREAI